VTFIRTLASLLLKTGSCWPQVRTREVVRTVFVNNVVEGSRLGVGAKTFSTESVVELVNGKWGLLESSEAAPSDLTRRTQWLDYDLEQSVFLSEGRSGGSSVTFHDLIEQARQGDRVALGRLLIAHDARLRGHISRRISHDLQGLLSVEDVLQETYIEAHRHIGGFEPHGPQAIYRWLAAIADHKLIDAARAAHAAKRPPPHRALTSPVDRSTSFLALAELVDDKGKTPSRVVAGQEAVRSVQVALAALPEACRQAVWMRHIEGQSVSEIATALGRTEHAVHQLCYRGLALLREQMGSRSRYLSDSR